MKNWHEAKERKPIWKQVGEAGTESQQKPHPGPIEGMEFKT